MYYLGSQPIENPAVFNLSSLLCGIHSSDGFRLNRAVSSLAAASTRLSARAYREHPADVLTPLLGSAIDNGLVTSLMCYRHVSEMHLLNV